MKKVGTLSSALGLIFIGVWMIIAKTNVGLGDKVFKWWPIIFVLLGVEILLSATKKDENTKIKFNFWFIPVLILFLVFNIYNGLSSKFKEMGMNGWDFGNFKNIARNIDESNYKELKGTKVLPVYGKGIVLDFENGDVNIKKSLDGNIKIDTDVYVEKNAPKKNYMIKELKEANGYRVSIKERYIKKLNMDVYIPDGYNLNINGENADVSQEDNLEKSSFDFKFENGNLDIKNALNGIFKFENADVNIENLKSVVIDGENSSLDIKGNVENITAKLEKADITVENELCKNIYIKADSGSIDFKTNDKNIDAQIDINEGTCNFNNEQNVNRGIRKTIGNGSGKLKIELESGTVDFSSQE